MVRSDQGFCGVNSVVSHMADDTMVSATTIANMISAVSIALSAIWPIETAETLFAVAEAETTALKVY
jgi:hypothetical protein